MNGCGRENIAGCETVTIDVAKCRERLGCLYFLKDGRIGEVKRAGFKN
jgi:hypothetical protein